MKQFDVVKQAEMIVGRYRVPQDLRQDLLHEAIVAGLDTIEAGETDESKIITNMRKAMYAYTNWKSLAVTVPDSGNTYIFKLHMNPDDYHKLSTTEKALYHALSGDVVSEEEADRLEATDEHTGLLLSLALDQLLTEDQATVFRKIAFMGYNKREVALSMGRSRQWVAGVYEAACKKIRQKFYGVAD